VSPLGFVEKIVETVLDCRLLRASLFLSVGTIHCDVYRDLLPAWKEYRVLDEHDPTIQ